MPWWKRPKPFDSSPGRGALARRLGVSFGRVALVATAACGLLLFFVMRVADSVHHMQQDEAAIRTGFGLATAIREQYIHIAHTLILADGSHLEHYAEWSRKVRAGATLLRSSVAEPERRRLERVDAISAELDRLLVEAVLPATARQDRERLVEAHQRAEDLASRAAQDADAVAHSVEARMSREHVDATRITRAAAWSAGLGILLLLSLSAASTHNLRNAVLRPLAALAHTAARIGAGDLTARVSVAAEGELGLMARAFDQMAEQLAMHQRRLVSSERMAAIGQLAAGVAHEINNPVAVIRGYLRTMIREADRDDLKKELEILDEEAAACQRIAEDLVAYARAPDINRSEVDVGALLLAAAERFEQSGESQGHRVRAQAEHLALSVDPVRLRQVVQNLLRNAVQASCETSAVELRGEVAPQGYRIRVLDRGAGIPEDVRARLFEPFSSGRINGTGLGLAVCNGILRAHGGQIEARSRSGGGTEFVVELPRVPRDVANEYV